MKSVMFLCACLSIAACVTEDETEELELGDVESELMRSSTESGCLVTFADGRTYSGTISGSYCKWGEGVYTLCGATVQSGGTHTAYC
jgi:hypothetical protein